MCTVRNPNIKVEFLLKLPTLLIVCLAGRVDRFFPSQKKKPVVDTCTGSGDTTELSFGTLVVIMPKNGLNICYVV